MEAANCNFNDQDGEQMWILTEMRAKTNSSDGEETCDEGRSHLSLVEPFQKANINQKSWLGNLLVGRWKRLLINRIKLKCA